MSNSEPTQKKSDLNEVSAHNDHHVCTPVYSVPSLKTANKHCGIINKGNTCYADVILQCLKVLPVLWSSNDQIKSTLYSSVRKMFQLHLAKSPIDPSFFLKSLKDVFFREGCSFDLHAQQDVVKVLEILLEELTCPSIITSAAYNIKASPVLPVTLAINLTEQKTSYLYVVFPSLKIFQPHLSKF